MSIIVQQDATIYSFSFVVPCVYVILSPLQGTITISECVQFCNSWWWVISRPKHVENIHKWNIYLSCCIKLVFSINEEVICPPQWYKTGWEVKFRNQYYYYIFLLHIWKKFLYCAWKRKYFSNEIWSWTQFEQLILKFLYQQDYDQQTALICKYKSTPTCSGY